MGVTRDAELGHPSWTARSVGIPLAVFIANISEEISLAMEQTPITCVNTKFRPSWSHSSGKLKSSVGNAWRVRVGHLNPEWTHRLSVLTHCSSGELGESHQNRDEPDESHLGQDVILRSVDRSLRSAGHPFDAGGDPVGLEFGVYDGAACWVPRCSINRWSGHPGCGIGPDIIRIGRYYLAECNSSAQGELCRAHH